MNIVQVNDNGINLDCKKNLKKKNNNFDNILSRIKNQEQRALELMKKIINKEN